MSDKDIRRSVRDPDALPPSRTDWQRLATLSDEEIDAAATSDPDAQPLTDAQLAKFRRVKPSASSSSDEAGTPTPEALAGKLLRNRR